MDSSAAGWNTPLNFKHSWALLSRQGWLGRCACLTLHVHEVPVPFPGPQLLPAPQEARPWAGMAGRAGEALEARTSEQALAQRAWGNSRRLPWSSPAESWVGEVEVTKSAHGAGATPRLLGESHSVPFLWCQEPRYARPGCRREMGRTPCLLLKKVKKKGKKVVLQLKKKMEPCSLHSVRGGRNTTVYFIFKLPLLHVSGLVWHVRSKVLGLSHCRKETTLKGAFLYTYFFSSSFMELGKFWSIAPQRIIMVMLLPHQQIPQCGFGHCLP